MSRVTNGRVCAMVMVLLTDFTEPSQEWNLIYWFDTDFLGMWGLRCSAPCLLCRHDWSLSKTNIWNYKNILRKSQSEHSCVLCFSAEGVWFLSGSGGLSWVQAPLAHAVLSGHTSAAAATVTRRSTSCMRCSIRWASWEGCLLGTWEMVEFLPFSQVPSDLG